MSTVKLSELAEKLQLCPNCGRSPAFVQGRNGCTMHGDFASFLQVQQAKEMILLPPGTEIIDDIWKKPVAAVTVAVVEEPKVVVKKKKKGDE